MKTPKKNANGTLLSQNSSEDQKKKKKKKVFINVEHFFSPKSGEDQNKEKKVLNKRTLFSPNLSLDVCIPIQIIGGDADVDHSQSIGRDTAKLLGGDISPPCFGTPDSDTFFSLFVNLFIYLFKQITLWEQNSKTTKARNLKFGQIIGLYMDLRHCNFRGAS